MDSNFLKGRHDKCDVGVADSGYYSLGDQLVRHLQLWHFANAFLGEDAHGPVLALPHFCSFDKPFYLFS